MRTRSFVAIGLALSLSGCLAAFKPSDSCAVVSRGGLAEGGWTGDGGPGTPGIDSTLSICGTMFVFEEATDSIVVQSLGERPLSWADAWIEAGQDHVRVWLQSDTNSTPVPLVRHFPFKLSQLRDAPIRQGDALHFCTERIVVGLPLSLRLADGGSGSAHLRSVDTCEPVVHDLTKCDEFDFYWPVPYSTFGLGPFRPVAADAAGRTMNRLQTVLTCEVDGAGEEPSRRVTAIFSLLVVEPLKHPSMQIPNSAGYQLLLTMTTTDPMLLYDWSKFGVKSTNATVLLVFSDQTGAPKSRASLKVGSQLHSFTADSTMTGTPGSGTKGQMGLYTFTERRPFLHVIDFSDYSYYSRGAATVQPGPLAGPANLVPAYHNIGFNVGFTLANPPPP